MGLLDANAEALDLSASNSFRAPSAPPEPGYFHNFGSSAGNYFMRSMAQAGRAGSMLLGAAPAALDWAIDPNSPAGRALELPNGTDAETGRKALADRYFAKHDEIFGDAVDFWTPKPSEVGAAGQIVGQLSGGIVKFLASAPLSVAEAQLTTGEELVRQGVDATTAQVAGSIAGLSTAVGIRAPAAVGNNLAQRVASGVAINVAQGAVAAEATKLTLEAGGAPQKVADQFNPFDLRGRTVDALMGAVFGAKAHVDVTQTQRDAIMLVNQARAMEEGALPGRPVTPADLNTAVDRTRIAMDQMARGQPVDVPGAMPRYTADGYDMEFRDYMEALTHLTPEQRSAVKEGAPPYLFGIGKPPIERPPMAAPESPPETAPARAGAQEPAPPRFDESVRVPSGEFDPATGLEHTTSANEHIAKAEADAAHIKTTAPGLFQAAAECLLGSI